MNLYEITNGYYGQSEVRVYAWAATEKRAIKIASMSFKEEGDDFPPKPNAYHATENMCVKLLFSSTAGEFVTEPSDSGFERGRNWTAPE